MIRESLNMPQKALAESIGVTQPQISRYEMGSSVPTGKFRQRLCETLGIEWKELAYSPPSFVRDSQDPALEIMAKEIRRLSKLLQESEDARSLLETKFNDLYNKCKKRH